MHMHSAVRLDRSRDILCAEIPGQCPDRPALAGATDVNEEVMKLPLNNEIPVL